MKLYSTKQAAKLARIHWVTLLRWVAAGKFRPSTRVGQEWLWTPADIKRLLTYRSKRYWHGQGRPRKVKK